MSLSAAPAGATIRRKMPPTSASTTLVILVVSISSSSSPSAKLCPCVLSHPTTLPSVIVRPHFGIVIALISELIAQRSSLRRAPPPHERPRTGRGREAREAGG